MLTQRPLPARATIAVKEMLPNIKMEIVVIGNNIGIGIPYDLQEYLASPLLLDVRFIYLIPLQKFLEILIIPNQNQFLEFAADRVFETCHLFHGADAGANSRYFYGFVIERNGLSFFLSKHHQFPLH